MRSWYEQGYFAADHSCFRAPSLTSYERPLFASPTRVAVLALRVGAPPRLGVQKNGLAGPRAPAPPERGLAPVRPRPTLVLLLGWHPTVSTRAAKNTARGTCED
jgi:hypothetical protein